MKTDNTMTAEQQWKAMGTSEEIKKHCIMALKRIKASGKDICAGYGYGNPPYNLLSASKRGDFIDVTYTWGDRMINFTISESEL